MEEQELENAVALLLDEMQGDLGTSHELFLRLKQTLDQMRAMGMPVPDDLERLERDLDIEFKGDAKG